MLLNKEKKIIQGGYDLPCKDYMREVYSNSETEYEEYNDPPITSACGKTSPPIDTYVFKIDATLFCLALPH